MLRRQIFPEFVYLNVGCVYEGAVRGMRLLAFQRLLKLSPILLTD